MDLSRVSRGELELLELNLEVVLKDLNKYLKSTDNIIDFSDSKLQELAKNYLSSVEDNKILYMIASKMMSLENLKLFSGNDNRERMETCIEFFSDIAFKIDMFVTYGDEYIEEYGEEIIEEDPISNEKINQYGLENIISAERKINEYPSYLIPGDRFSQEELPYICDKFSEGNSDYANILYNLNTNGLYTCSGCIGHEEYDIPYVMFIIPKENLEFFNRFIEEYMDKYGDKIIFDGEMNSDNDDEFRFACAIYAKNIEEREKFYKAINDSLELAKNNENKNELNVFPVEKIYDLFSRIYELSSGELKSRIDINSNKANLDISKVRNFSSDVSEILLSNLRFLDKDNELSDLIISLENILDNINELGIIGLDELSRKYNELSEKTEKYIEKSDSMNLDELSDEMKDAIDELFNSSSNELILRTVEDLYPDDYGDFMNELNKRNYEYVDE